MNNESRQNSKSSAHKQHGSHVSWLMGQGWYWSGTVSFPKQKNNPHSCLLSHVITSCRPRHHYSCRRRRRRLLVRVAYRLSTIAYHIILSVSYHHRLSVVVVCCRIVVVANRLWVWVWVWVWIWESEWVSQSAVGSRTRRRRSDQIQWSIKFNNSHDQNMYRIKQTVATRQYNCNLQACDNHEKHILGEIMHSCFEPKHGLLNGLPRLNLFALFKRYGGPQRPWLYWNKTFFFLVALRWTPGRTNDQCQATAVHVGGSMLPVACQKNTSVGVGVTSVFLNFRCHCHKPMQVVANNSIILMVAL